MKKTILLVDPEASLRVLCVEPLRSMGFETHVAESEEQALAVLEGTEIEVVLLDVRSPSLGSLDLLRAIKQESPETDVVVMADSTAIPAALEAVQQGAYDYLSNIGKPFKVDDLKHLLQRLAEKQQLAAENRLLREELSTIQGFGSLIGTSEVMQKIYRLILKVAAKRHPVLILGESGTGKELVARAIHSYSPWHDKPFVPIDVGALPPTLIESELFGHVRGAFTGADQSRVGLLASAQGGTIFLDEIGELPVALQAKLLRALQEREFRTMGSNVATKMDARIVAATNRDIEAAIKQGAFRKDLYYRLNVVSVKMPPLRERKGDIPALVHSFIDRHRGEEGAITGISYEALTCLMNYDWPGNVRELENCVQHALALGSGSLIQVKDLPPDLVAPVPLTEATAEPVAGARGDWDRNTLSLQQLERRAILQALRETGGDRQRAAKLLGIGKTTIYRKLKEYGIEDALTSPPSPLAP